MRISTDYVLFVGPWLEHCHLVTFCQQPQAWMAPRFFYGFIVCGKVRVKHPGYKIIGFVNIEL
ncbi:hypothetical protein, partial [Salmonella enterica]|uniref:hypothetical protein n=1 Tax=Salmonella enterica TaxID=28901 RepID=UPI0009AD2093